MKDTELGLLPIEWKVVSLQKLIDSQYVLGHLDGNHGALYPKKNEFVDSGISYLSANCILNGRIDFKLAKHLTIERASKFRKGVAKNNDVLFAHNATVGPVAHLKTQEEYVILGTSLTYYRTDSEKLIPRYLMYYMESDFFRFQYERRMGQSTRNQVPITVQKEFLHVVPPLPEQKKIAKILSTVDNHIDEVNGMIEDLKELKKGLMQKLLIQGIGHTEFKDSPVGRIPVEWEVGTIEDIALVASSKRIAKSEYVDEGVRFFRSKEIIDKYLNRVGTDEYYISKDRFEEIKSKFGAPVKNDILITAVGTLGVPYLVEDVEFYFKDGNLLWLREISDLMNAEFIFYFFSSDEFIKQVNMMTGGSSQSALTIEKLKKMYIYKPSLIEQCEIVDMLRCIDDYLMEMNHEKLDFVNMKKGLMQQLLTGKTRVKIDE